MFMISQTGLLLEGLVVEGDGGGSLLVLSDRQQAQTQESKAESQHPALKCDHQFNFLLITVNIHECMYTIGRFCTYIWLCQ